MPHAETYYQPSRERKWQGPNLTEHKTNTAIAFGSKFYRRNACYAGSFNIPLVGMTSPELADMFIPSIDQPPTTLHSQNSIYQLPSKW